MSFLPRQGSRRLLAWSQIRYCPRSVIWDDHYATIGCSVFLSILTHDAVNQEDWSKIPPWALPSSRKMSLARDLDIPIISWGIHGHDEGWCWDLLSHMILSCHPRLLLECRWQKGSLIEETTGLWILEYGVGAGAFNTRYALASVGPRFVSQLVRNCFLVPLLRHDPVGALFLAKSSTRLSRCEAIDARSASLSN